MNNKKIGRILKLCAFALVCVILAVVIFTVFASLFSDAPLPMAFGYGACFVVSGSMEPTLSVNDVIVVKEIDIPEIGDMVLYQSNGSLVVHRVVDLANNGNTVVTKGDANEVNDIPFSRDAIVGKVVCVVPAIGHVIAFLKSVYGIITLVLCAVIIYLSVYLIKQSKKSENSEAAENSAD